MNIINDSILEVAGLVTVTILYSTPIIDIYRLSKFKIDVEKYPYMILFTLVINCFFWAIFSYLSNYSVIFLINIYGLIVNTLCMIVYIKTYPISEDAKSIYTGLIFILILFFMVFTKTNNFSNIFYGSLADIFNFCIALSIYQKIKPLLRRREKAYISRNFIIILLLNSIIWLIYHLTQELNFLLLISYSISAILCIIQIYIYFYICNN